MPTPSSISLVISDIDGTLITSNHEVTLVASVTSWFEVINVPSMSEITREIDDGVGMRASCTSVLVCFCVQRKVRKEPQRPRRTIELVLAQSETTSELFRETCANRPRCLCQDANGSRGDGGSPAIENRPAPGLVSGPRT